MRKRDRAAQDQVVRASTSDRKRPRRWTPPSAKIWSKWDVEAPENPLIFLSASRVLDLSLVFEDLLYGDQHLPVLDRRLCLNLMTTVK